MGVIKEKTTSLGKQDKKIETLGKQIIEKDKLAKDLKLKVSKLINEFTKGFKEKEEELSMMNKKCLEKSNKIKIFVEYIKNLKDILANKDEEISTKMQAEKEHSDILNELFKKISQLE